jgi:hypothetical protein
LSVVGVLPSLHSVSLSLDLETTRMTDSW